MRVAAMIAALVSSPAAVAAGPYDGWVPHRYCNAMDGIEATRIPPLSAEQAQRVESLEQVQIIARHGARAPYSKLFCWDSPKHNPMAAEWNCTTTSVSVRTTLGGWAVTILTPCIALCSHSRRMSTRRSTRRDSGACTASLTWTDTTFSRGIVLLAGCSHWGASSTRRTDSASMPLH